MAAAVVSAYQDTGAAGATKTKVDSVGGTAPKFGTDDAVQSATPIAIPNSTGTAYSADKLFRLNIDTVGATNIANRQIKLAANPSDAGIKFFWKDLASYVQGAAPASSGSAGPATPSGYTALTTSYQQWDNTSVATSSLGKNGDWVAVLCGVDNSFAAGGGAFTNPDISLQYDES